jgi:ubiquitin conjugation factor E4 B
VDRIEVAYFRRNPRIDIKELTKLNADQQTSDEFYGQKAEGSNNFITEIFFLSLAGQQYGTQSIKNKLKRLEKDLDFMEKQLATLEADRAKFINVS